MTSLVDAFVVELGLDPSSLQKGQRDALDSLFAMRQKGAAAGKQVEDQFKKIADSFESFGRKAVGFLTLVLGGVGFVRMISSVVQSDKALGLLSDTTRLSVEDLSRWRYAFERAGGSAEGITSVLLGMTRELQSTAAGGSFSESSLYKVLTAFSNYGANINPLDASGKHKAATDIYLEIADAIPRMLAANVSKDAIAAHLRSLPGMDETTLAVTLRGGAELRKYLAEQGKIAEATKDSRAAADELNRAYKGLQQSSTNLGRTILRLLHEPLVKMFNTMQEMVAWLNKAFKLGIGEEKPSGEGGTFGQRGGHRSLSDWIGDKMKGGTATPGGSSSSAPIVQPGDHSKEINPPPEVLEQGKDMLLKGGSTGELQQFMRANGYPMSGNWCGQFAASVVTAAGGTPPKGAAIASNWRGWGQHVDQPQPGDIAARGVPGRTGGHVGFVYKVYPDGSIDMLGGNQGRALIRRKAGEFEYRRGIPDVPNKAIPWVGPQWSPTLAPQQPIIQKNYSTKTDISGITVNSQASDPVGIASDIMSEIKKQGTAFPREASP